MKTSLYTLSAMAIAASLTLAQEAPKPAGGPGGAGGPPKHERPNPEAIFKKLDTNSDGFLSLEEFKAGPRGQKDPAKAEEIFKKMDQNGDGKVTLDEFMAHHPPHHPPHHPGGPPPSGATPPPAPPVK